LDQFGQSASRFIFTSQLLAPVRGGGKHPLYVTSAFGGVIYAGDQGSLIGQDQTCGG
jgi:hypothetical protein